VTLPVEEVDSLQKPPPPSKTTSRNYPELVLGLFSIF